MRIAPLMLLCLLATGAATASAEELAEYNDSVFLYDHETVRYRIDLEYGSSGQVDVDIYVRGYGAPPRVRVIDSDGHEVKEEEDTSGDWILDFDFLAHDHGYYYIEVDSEWPGEDSDFDVNIRATVPDGDGAFADVTFVKIFEDYESGDDSDHYDCAARSGARGLPIALLLVMACGVLAWRRRYRAAA